ncbi:pilin [Patescibacteria group bacterium]|nr:pilin [Patescibacteria group bacterium]MBU4481553.1 pilin [Patescibacteria group bacterium]
MTCFEKNINKWVRYLLILVFFILSFSNAEAATSTTFTLSVNDSTPDVGNTIIFSGGLVDASNGNGLADKEIEFVNANTSFALGTSTTNINGSSTHSLSVPCGETFSVKAKFAGGGDYLASQSANVTITPTSQTGTCNTLLTLTVSTTTPLIGNLAFNGKLINGSNGNILPPIGVSKAVYILTTNGDLLKTVSTSFSTGIYSSSINISCNTPFSMFAQYIEETISGIEYANAASPAISISPTGGSACSTPTSKIIVSSPLQITQSDDFSQSVIHNGSGYYVKNNFFKDGTIYNNSGAVTTFTYATTSIGSRGDKHQIKLKKDISNQMEIVQEIEYIQGKNYYTRKWEIKNIGGSPLNNLRIKKGTFPGMNGYAHYISDSKMISAWNSGTGRFFGAQASISTAASSYGSTYIGSNAFTVAVSSNSDFWNVAYDAFTYGGIGHGLGWHKDALAPGETWAVKSYEYFKTPSYSAVIPPFDDDEKIVGEGDELVYKFTIINTDSSARTFNLTAKSKANFPVSITDIADNAITSVALTFRGYTHVLVKVKTAVIADDYDIITLTATDSIDNTKKNSDFVVMMFLSSCNLSISPKTIFWGQEAKLKWTTYAASLAYIDNEIGYVSPVSSGTISLFPENPTTYIMTVSGTGGSSATCQTSISGSECPQGGLVPCGRQCNDRSTPNVDESASCTLCHLFVMLDRIIDFLLIYILFPIAVLMLVIAGVLYVGAVFEILPGGFQTISQAKGIILSVVLGLIVIFVAFILIGLFLKLIGLADWTTALYQNWWSQGFFQVNCPIK